MIIYVVIPALNEGSNIKRLIGEIPQDSSHAIHIVVVDNGSTDDTAAEATSVGADVVSEPRRGYGYACYAGIRSLSSQPDDVIVVFMDGDGSFAPAELPLLIEPIEKGIADMVLGSRVLGGIEPGSMPPHQRFGNQLVSALMRLLYRVQITDLGPYRAIRLGLLRRLDMQEMTFGFPTEMIVKTAKLGARIIEVPVVYRRRWTGKSKVSGTLRGTLLATYFILGVTLKYAFRSTVSE